MISLHPFKLLPLLLLGSLALTPAFAEGTSSEAAAKAAEAELKQARAALEAAQKAAKKAENTRKKTEQQIARNLKSATENENRAKNARLNITKREQAAADMEKKLQDDHAFLADLRDVAAKAPERTPDAQKENAILQEELRKKVELLKELAKLEELKRDPMFQKDFTPQDITLADFASLDLVDAYAQARELEKRITESYKDIKALELAMQAKMDFKAAEHLTDVAQAVRRDSNVEVLRNTPKTQKEFDAQKQEQVETVHETERMVDATLAMMEAATEIVRTGEQLAHQHLDMPHILQKFDLDFEKTKPEPPPPQAQPDPMAFQDNQAKPEEVSENVQDMVDKAYFAEQLRNAAAETSEKAKDLSDLMKAVDQAVQDKTKKEEMKEKVQQILAENKNRTPKPGDVPSLSNVEPNLIPGNIIDLSGSSGIPCRWVYLSSWYVIGPFDNPNRINLTRKFAPESAVDLNAAYLGRNGERVRWQFVQTNNNPDYKEWDGVKGRLQAMLQPPGDPPYTIWYGYTEVFFDRECDLWLATGSDDRSDIWINDMHVWNSSNQLKEWSINEGFRKVHFRKGRNRVLVRLENGWHTMGYSVALYLGDSDNPAL